MENKGIKQKNQIYVIGIGPGEYRKMTIEAVDFLEQSDVIVGYKTYISLIRSHFPKKEFLETSMRGEVKRCHMAFQEAQKGKKVAVISSGDAGIYGMAGLLYELKSQYPDVEVTVIPGMTAASSGAAILGAPLVSDFAVISLSDLLTPWEMIETRLKKAAEGDFAIVIYNPASHKRADYLKRACTILEEILPGDRICGFVRNIGREEMKWEVGTLRQIKETEADMFTTVFIGNSHTQNIDGKMVTSRGYQIDKRKKDQTTGKDAY